jgi:hypothetical protein
MEKEMTSQQIMHVDEMELIIKDPDGKIVAKETILRQWISFFGVWFLVSTVTKE